MRDAPPRDGALAGLDGLRVADASLGIAGAYCAKLLGDAGATVTKVEPPGGSPLRRRTQTGTLGDDGHPDGALWRFLAAGHDVAATFDPRVVDVAIVEPDAEPGELAHAHSGLVVVCHSDFGLTGPRARERRPDLLLQALSGGLMTHGRPDGAPLMVGGALTEWATGLYGALGAVTALSRGTGALVDVSALEVMTITLANYPTIQAALPGWKAKRSTFLMVPGVEPCADGFVGIATITAEQWHTFVSMIGRPDLIDDDTLLVQPRRVERPDVVAAIRDWTRQRTVAEVVELATLHRIPAVPIGNGETLPGIEQVAARGVFDREMRPRHPFRATRAPAATVAASGAPPTAPPRPPALEGVRVLDLTAFLAGPFATHYLASAGADVIKVESVQRPDPMRFNVRLPPSVDRWYDQGNIYLGVNLNKRDITLNLADPRGRDILLRLAATCDVVIENFTPRVLEQFGLTYERFCEVRPGMIMVRMPGFGLDGPWRDRPGFAASMEQVSGLAWVTGYRDGIPNIPGACDPIAGAHAAFAVITALAHRDRTGEGQHIELAMLDMAANLVAEQVLEYHAYGHLMTCEENRSRAAAPQGVYRAADGEWVALSVGTDAEWVSLCDVLGRDPSAYPTLSERRAAHDRIDDWVSAWCAGRPQKDVLRALGPLAEPVVNAYDADKDEQMIARGFWEPVEHPLVGELRYPGWPMRLVPGPDRWYRAPAPLLGQHNDEVLAELGLTGAERDALRADGVIGDRLP
ncbi:MAG TPA: CoA transferase [Acidimicrobiales bacterium]|nr:CoA transferase [Acidimicrobiales bacterium]